VPLFHSLARCCWCGGRFVKAKFFKADVWVCETPQCQARQTEQSLIRTVKTAQGEEKRCLYLPLPKQVEFEDAVRSFKRVLFGGAAGGSKSHALRWHLYKQALRIPRFRALLLRKNLVELERTHISDAEFEARLFNGKLNKSKYYLRFPNGSQIDFGHLADKEQVTKHLSTQYDSIAFDEITTFPETERRLIMSRARTTKEIDTKIIAGTNPGGPDSYWVKRRWLQKDLTPTEEPGYRPEQHVYIPSKLEDNPYLDEDYEQSLMDLPEVLRRAYRDGDWDIFPGQFFSEWRRAHHVVPTGRIYDGRWVVAVDWGYMAPGVALFACISADGRITVVKEYVFKMTIASEVAKEIAKAATSLGIKRLTGPGDTEMWKPQTDSGESIAETFTRFGVHLTKADKDRVNGWQRLRHWLRPAPDGDPWLQVTEDCPYLSRTIPSLVMHEKFPEDIADGLEDHAADALRYLVMSRPSPEHALSTIDVPENSPAWLMRQGKRTTHRQQGQIA